MTSGTYELSRGIAVETAPASAGLGIRLLATAVDAVIIGTTVTIAGTVVHLALALLPGGAQAYEGVGLGILAAVITLGYFVSYWGLEGTTPGKKMLGLCVTRPGTLDTQSPIGVRRAILRVIGMTAGNLFFADLVFAVLHQDRRALHDLMADSIVVPRR